MKIARSEILRVASLNIDSNSDHILERTQAVVNEAVDLGVEVLLLQELASDSKQDLLNMFREAGFIHSYVTEGIPKKRDGNMYVSTGIVSKIPLHDTIGIKPTILTGAYRAAVATVSKNGYNILLISTHLIWGGENTGIRLQQVHILSDHAQRYISRIPGTLCVLGGTLNDAPDADTIRYLTGKKASAEESRTSFWVDATNNSELENMPTTRTNSRIWQEAAKSTGILAPEFVPPVKSDYIFSKGWVYGSPGMPFNTQLFGTYTTDSGVEVSDHYGFVSDIWIPNK